jgi:hypothetical protein
MRMHVPSDRPRAWHPRVERSERRVRTASRAVPKSTDATEPTKEIRGAKVPERVPGTRKAIRADAAPGAAEVRTAPGAAEVRAAPAKLSATTEVGSIAAWVASTDVRSKTSSGCAGTERALSDVAGNANAARVTKPGKAVKRSGIASVEVPLG